MTNPLDLCLRHFHLWRSAHATVKLCDEIGFEPELIVDCGANNSQETKRWLRRWPNTEVLSIEPDRRFNPVGTVLRYALSDQNGIERLNPSSASSCLGGDGEEVAVRRLEQFLPTGKRTLLKVDCENRTWEVLRGAGERLAYCSVAHVEIVNYYPPGTVQADWPNRTMDIYALMADYGFNQCRVVDAVCWLRHVDYYDAVFYRA